MRGLNAFAKAPRNSRVLIICSNERITSRLNLNPLFFFSSTIPLVNLRSSLNDFARRKRGISPNSVALSLFAREEEASTTGFIVSGVRVDEGGKGPSNSSISGGRVSFAARPSRRMLYFPSGYRPTRLVLFLGRRLWSVAFILSSNSHGEREGG